MSCVAGLVLPALAEVTTTVTYRTYNVGGSTATGIVRYMRTHPFQGDHGQAYANIDWDYRMSFDTAMSGNICKVTDLDVAASFVITLPKATQLSQMSPKTKAAWNGFASFAKNHEEHHRQSLTDCARSFAAKARRATAGQCHALDSELRQMLRQAKRDCEAKQIPYDRQQSRAVQGLSLFARARQGL